MSGEIVGQSFQKIGAQYVLGGNCFGHVGSPRSASRSFLHKFLASHVKSLVSCLPPSAPRTRPRRDLSADTQYSGLYFTAELPAQFGAHVQLDDDMYRDDVYSGHEGPYGANSGDHGYNNRSYPEDRDNEAYEARLYWRERERLADGRTDRDWGAPPPGSDRAGHIGAGRMAQRAAATRPASRGARDHGQSSTYRPANFRSNDAEPTYFTGAHGSNAAGVDKTSTSQTGKNGA
jgi:hypothetical protein